MNKQLYAKLELLLGGLNCKIVDNYQFLEEIKGTLISGVNKTSFYIVPEKDLFTFKSGALEKRLRADEITAALAMEAFKFEALAMDVLFRGETLQVIAEEGRASVKNLDIATAVEAASKNLHKTEGGMTHAKTAFGGLQPNRNYIIKPGQADRLLKELGIMAENGKIKNDRIRKYNQIDHFVELLSPLAQGFSHSKNEVLIVDCACGKSYLSFVLNYWLTSVLKTKTHFLCIDNNQKVVDDSRETANRLGYRNMTFLCADLREVSVDGSGPLSRKPDLVISLHACDIATDFALAFGINNSAAAIVAVPCCQHELLGQIKTHEPICELLKYGPIKAKLADLLTDGLRCLLLEANGYDVSCVEWVSPLETPKNLMIRASLSGKADNAKLEAYHALTDSYNLRPMLSEIVNSQIYPGSAID